MALLVERHWKPLSAPWIRLSRRDRHSCDYAAYVPDRLAKRLFVFEAGAAADIADAERAIVRLDGRVISLVDTEALAKILLRAESVASSRIEGLEIGARHLLWADAAQQLGDAPRDATAVEVLANIDAMSFAMQAIHQGDAIALDHLLEVHRRLLTTNRLAAHAGRIRTEQNWIGGSNFNPCSAVFVPPPPEHVAELLEDLCAFCNEDSLPAMAQAAIAHAQFETIHPFVDGNGRVGRTLIHLVLRRRGLTSRVTPPISLILSTQADNYLDGLTATRFVGSPTSRAAHEGMNLWVGRFAAACHRAVADTEAFENGIEQLEREWRRRLGSIRSRSATDLLLKKLPGTPVLTVQSASDLIGRSFQATNEAITRLVEAHILIQGTAGQRNRAFEATELIKAFTDFERRLASPARDTRVEKPSRPVPYRSRRRPNEDDG